MVFRQPSVSVDKARLVETVGPEWSTRWLTLRVGGSGRLVWVIPVTKGTRADASGNELFWAFESATAPRIRPPKSAPLCNGSADSLLESTAELSDAPTLAPTEIAVLDDVSAVGAFVTQQGISFDASSNAKLEPFGPFFAVVYEVTDAAWTDGLRLAMPDLAPPLETAWLGSSVEVTLFTLGEGRARPNGEQVGVDDLNVTFQLSDEKSDYAERRKMHLTQGLGERFLTEATGSTPLFGWSVLPANQGAIEPAAKTYFSRKKVAVDACFGAVLDAQASTSPVGRACAPGALGVVPGGEACNESVVAGEVSADSLRCGDADDLALAFAGFHLNQLRLTRDASVTGVDTPSPLLLSIEPGSTQSPLVSAENYDQKGCVLGGTGGAGGTGSGTGWSGGSGWSGGPGYPENQYPQEPEPDTHVEVSCWGNTDSGNDSCSGDSSDSGDEGDTCGGDSSSDSGDDTCSGDSSSDSGDDTCSGDSSSGDGDTCSGDSGSSGGDSCSGDSGGGDSCSSGSSGSGDCSVARVRRPRVKVSALTLLLIGLALPLRRVTRKRRR